MTTEIPIDARVVTASSQIRDLPKRWKKHFYHPDKRAWAFGGLEDKYEALSELDPEVATMDDVTRIIGNDTWLSELVCHNCGRTAVALAEFAWENEEGYGEKNLRLCIDCLQLSASRVAATIIRQASKTTEWKL